MQNEIGQNPKLLAIPLGISDGAVRTTAAEREARLDAVINDPLLPVRLPGATGLVVACKGRRRVEVLRDASRHLRTFKPE